MVVIRSRTLVLPEVDIDTDQIIPARFLTTTTRDGLGRHLFADWRYDGEGELRADCHLNHAGAADCQVLVVGRNFGCGSSREHAPWALLDFGFRAVVSSHIADIFRSNAVRNGLLPVVVDERTHQRLLERPGLEIEIDVAERVVALPDGERVGFDLDEFARYCLLNGVDELEYLLRHSTEIARFEEQRPWKP